MEKWVIFVALYGIFKGIREPIKKKALEKTDVMSMLFMYTFIGFLMSVPFARDVFSVKAETFVLIFSKSLLLFFAWLTALYSIKNLPVSLYGVINMSRVVFSTLLGVIILGETLNLTGIISLLLVTAGVGLAGSKKAIKAENCRYTDIILVFISCIFNAVSGIFDKYIMTTQNITSAQLLFWYMLFVSIMYLLYIVITKRKIDIIASLKNPYIYMVSFLLVFGDVLLFLANKDAQSKVTVMTLIKQCSVLVTIFCGKFIYKEKNILKKIICAVIIILGIMLAV